MSDFQHVFTLRAVVAWLMKEQVGPNSFHDFRGLGVQGLGFRGLGLRV